MRILSRAVVVLSISTLPLAAQNLAGPGVSIELARHRAATIRNVRYDLGLDVTAPDSAAGRVTVHWTRSDWDEAIFDFRGRRLTGIEANGHKVPLAAFNGHHITLSARALANGDNTATFTFVSDIAPTGASIIKT